MLIGKYVLVDSISNGRIQYNHLGSSLVLTSKVISYFFEMYLLFFLSMKEQVINSLRHVGKCYPKVLYFEDIVNSLPTVGLLLKCDTEQY